MMEKIIYLLALNFIIPLLPSASTSSYSDKNSKCNVVLKNSGRVSHDSLNTYLAECSHIDYSISIDSDQVIVLKLRFETEKIFRIKEDENIFEIFDERFPSTPTSIVSRNKFSDSGESTKVMKFTSSHNNMVLRVFKLKTNVWLPFTASYRPRGICPSDQQRCLGEDDCFDNSSRCDGIWDCTDYGSDELNCTGCSNMYRCRNKTTNEVLCFRITDRCNGRPMCMNGDDQRNCNEKQCNRKNEAFLCKNKKCIRSNWVCDGIDDCRDSSDESNCNAKSPVTMIAVTGSISCIILSFIIIWFSCKLYMLRKKRSRERAAMLGGGETLVGPIRDDEREWWDFFFRDCRPDSQSRLMCHHGQHISPITEVQNEIYARLSAPPPYPIAMVTSRPFEEVMAEERAQRASETPGGQSDDELLDPIDSRPDREASEDDSLLVLQDNLPSTCQDIPGNIDAIARNQLKKAKIIGTRSVEGRTHRICRNRVYDEEPPTFEEAVGETSDGRSASQVDNNCSIDSEGSDNNSGRVPPSYSSLFPLINSAEQTSNANSESANQNENLTSAKRFSILRALQNLKSKFLRWNSRSNSSSLTELVEGQEEFSSREFCNLEHEIQRFILTRATNLSSGNASVGRISRRSNQNDLLNVEVQPLEVDANLIQWEIDPSEQLPDHSSNFSRISSENQLLPGIAPQGMPELGLLTNCRSAFFSAEGVFEGDYNAGASSESENDEKDS